MSRREFSLEIFFFPFGYLAVPETPWSGNARVCVLCSFYEKSNVHELNAIISLKKNLYIQHIYKSSSMFVLESSM